MIGTLLRAGLIVGWMSTVARAGDEVSMRVRSHGSAIDLVFKNESKRMIEIPTAVEADERMWDWLSVELDGPVRRTIGFLLARDKSAPVTVKLAPKATATETIDLARWVIVAGEAPLAPGTYRLTATWDATRETVKFKATATAKLVIPAPVDNACKQPRRATKGLELLARQVKPNAPVVELGLHNAGKTAICVYARVDAGGIQSDWYEVHLDVNKTSRKLVFNDVRTRAFVVVTKLAPGATAALALRKYKR